MKSLQQKGNSSGTIDYMKFLDIKYWRYWINRIKYDTPFWISFLFLFISNWIMTNIFIRGLDFYIERGGYFIDLIFISTFLFVVYISNTGTSDLLELINLMHEKDIFATKESFNNYMIYIRKIYNSKIELYLSFISAIIFGIGYLLFIADNINLGILNILNYIITFVMGFIFILLITSGLIQYIYGYRFLKILGKEEKVPLRVSYEDLKIGLFDKFGKFVMKISIPSIILGTFFSAFGLYLVLVVKDYNGYTFIGISAFATIIFVLLLYKNTMNIHKSIIKSKTDLKEKLIKQIDIIEKNTEMKPKDIYQTIYNIHSYIEKVNEISNWPFDSASIKKLVFTIGSSVVPLVLSLFGFA